MEMGTIDQTDVLQSYVGLELTNMKFVSSGCTLTTFVAGTFPTY